MFPSIKESMRVKLNMEGSVNCRAFKCTGEGEGKPYEGTRSMNIEVTEGGPLPFAFDIISHCFAYGQKMFIKHPKDIPDFFKQSFPEGYTWEREVTFEDGGVLAINQDTSLQNDCFICNIKVIGTNFPPNGPVMQKKTCGWEPSAEVVIPRDGGLMLRNSMTLKLIGGGHLACLFKTTFRSKTRKDVKLPEFHFQDIRLERKGNDNGKTFELFEASVARYSPLPPKHR
uniref:Fluorescent protein n=1 Tax=Cribrinopsis japonica TaxID=1799150 RepID=A0A146FGB2_CRIJA|nr:fluorescent protein [Cribrinopsis japonica]